jgi:hypothetical protein
MKCMLLPGLVQAERRFPVIPVFFKIGVHNMKQFALFLALVFPLAGAFAQTPREDQRDRGNRESPPGGAPRFETVTVTGDLVLLNGRIALKSDSGLYYVPGIRRLIGFVEGLTEGARVSLEGYVFKRPTEEANLLAITRLSIGGKVYDIPWRGSFAGTSPDRYRSGPGCFGPPDRSRGEGPRGWSGGPGGRRSRRGNPRR